MSFGLTSSSGYDISNKNADDALRVIDMSSDRVYKFRQSIEECFAGDTKSDSDRSRLKLHMMGRDTRCGPGSNAGGFQFQEFCDETLDLRDDYAYDSTEMKKQVNDVALNRYISRILFSAAMNDEGQDHYGMCEYQFYSNFESLKLRLSEIKSTDLGVRASIFNFNLTTVEIL